GGAARYRRARRGALRPRLAASLSDELAPGERLPAWCGLHRPALQGPSLFLSGTPRLPPRLPPSLVRKNGRLRPPVSFATSHRARTSCDARTVEPMKCPASRSERRDAEMAFYFRA